MSLTGRLSAAAKSTGNLATDILVGATVVSAGAGALGTFLLGLKDTFVEGMYQGNIVDRVMLGIKGNIPFLADKPVIETITNDLSAGVAAALTGVAAYGVYKAFTSFQNNYNTKKQAADNKDSIKENADNLIYQIRQDARVEEVRKHYTQKSPTHSG